MKQSDYPSKRLIIVGSITRNTNTLAGNVPPKANLGDMRGLASEYSKRYPRVLFVGGGDSKDMFALLHLHQLLSLSLYFRHNNRKTERRKICDFLSF
ncbi:hypothetical protein L2E82_15316 [Cichorium intybus]|uniref:Uncharacterized protein n=1 Tax=Cichorium intybus TaxID=13427 RepID=A0ACB9F2W2_CICIN|nr:hypothetical protein L2E82_15316 [Cichorium intybus]